MCFVVNEGADLPELPEGVEVEWVNFQPNPLRFNAGFDNEEVYNAIRIDKGRRILAGMHHAGGRDYKGYFMIVDDDDFVNRNIVSFVKKNYNENGWYIHKGYIYDINSKFLLRYRKFSDFCGTSLIVRADLYNLPPTIEATSDDYIRKFLGSHIFIKDILKNAGTPLSPLPFYGAMYRIGHSGAVSQSKSLKNMFFSTRNPVQFIKNILKLRPLTSFIRKEFTL